MSTGPVASTSTLPTEESEKMLHAAAARNEMSEADWPAMRSTLQHKIGEHIATFRTSENALYDKAATPPWPMGDGEIKTAEGRLATMLEQFQTEPPFTLQRLAELAIDPSPHYTSLPKYLRALERCLLVSSPLTAFPPAPSAPLDDSAGLLSNGRGTRSRSNSVSTPLLSPIPFLVRNSLAPGSPGRVDELDLGDGTATMALDGPVALSSTTTGEGVQSPPETPPSLPNGVGSDTMDVDPEAATRREGQSEAMDVAT